MYIILKHDHIEDNKKVIDILHDYQYEKYIQSYLLNQIPDLQDNSVSWSIENYSLIKKKNMINKGYLYNNKIEKQTKILTLEVYSYDANNIEKNYEIKKNKLWENINTEINNRVLKSMDKTELYQVFIKINENLQLKQNWSNYEYINLLNDLLKNFKKELYSSIAKKLKRFTKKS